MGREKENEEKQGRLKSILVNIFLIVSAIVLVLAIILVFTNKTDDLYILGYKPFIISTESMEPNYKVNSIVIVKKSNFNDVKEGDIIAFSSKMLSGKNVFHRATEITEQGIITKGDNNDSIDQEFVTEETFIGTETFHTNALVGITTELLKPYGFVKIIILPIAIIILLVLGIKFIAKGSKKKTVLILCSNLLLIIFIIIALNIIENYKAQKINLELKSIVEVYKEQEQNLNGEDLKEVLIENSSVLGVIKIDKIRD